MRQRTELAHKVGMTQHVIKELVNRADLMRINGVGTVFANLLEDAGVNKLLKAIVKFGFLDLKNDVKPLNFFRLE